MSEPQPRKIAKKTIAKPIAHTLKIDQIDNQVTDLRELVEKELGALKDDNVRLHSLLAEQNDLMKTQLSLIQERNLPMCAYDPAHNS